MATVVIYGTRWRARTSGCLFAPGLDVGAFSPECWTRRYNPRPPNVRAMGRWWCMAGSFEARFSQRGACTFVLHSYTPLLAARCCAGGLNRTTPMRNRIDISDPVEFRDFGAFSHACWRSKCRKPRGGGSSCVPFLRDGRLSAHRSPRNFTHTPRGRKSSSELGSAVARDLSNHVAHATT